MTGGLLRMRGERRSPYYRIGSAPGVEQPLDHAPSPSFPLIAPSGDDFVFNYSAGIEGEMTVVDPATLSRDWVVRLQYKRADGWDRLLHDAYDNDRTGFDGDFYTIKPLAEAETPAAQ